MRLRSHKSQSRTPLPFAAQPLDPFAEEGEHEDFYQGEDDQSYSFPRIWSNDAYAPSPEDERAAAVLAGGSAQPSVSGGALREEVRSERLSRPQVTLQTAGTPSVPPMSLPAKFVARESGEKLSMDQTGPPPARSMHLQDAGVQSYPYGSYGEPPIKVSSARGGEIRDVNTFKKHPGAHPPVMSTSVSKGGNNPPVGVENQSLPSQRIRGLISASQFTDSNALNGLPRSGGLPDSERSREHIDSSERSRSVPKRSVLDTALAGGFNNGGRDGRRAPGVASQGPGGGDDDDDSSDEDDSNADPQGYGGNEDDDDDREAWNPPGGGGGGPSGGDGGRSGGGGGNSNGRRSLFRGGGPPGGGGGGGGPGRGPPFPMSTGRGRGRGRGRTPQYRYSGRDPAPIDSFYRALLPKAEVVKLTEDNWAVWAKVARNTLVKMGIEYTIESDCEGYPEDIDAWAYLVSTLSGDYQNFVDLQSMNSAYQLWVSLTSMFEELAQPKITLYSHKLRLLSMKPKEDPKSYCRRGVALVNALRNVGGVYQNGQLCSDLIAGLSSDYADLAPSLEIQMSTNPSVTVLETSLTVRYIKLQARHKKDDGDHQPRSPRPLSPGPSRPALRVKVPDRSSHNVSNAGNTPRSPVSPRSPFAANQGKGGDDGCHYCGQKGHFKSNCIKAMYDKAVESGSFDVRTVNQRSVHCVTGSRIASDLANVAWLLDSGSTDHISPVSDVLTDYVKYSTPGYITVANGQREEILGHGTANVLLPNGNTFRLFEVKHVPSASRFLMSSARLHADGLVLNIRGMQCFIEDRDHMKVCDAAFSGSYFWFVDYSLPGHSKRVRWADLTGLSGGSTGTRLVPSIAQVSLSSRMPDIWHRRYCHVSPDLLKKTQGAVVGMTLPSGNLRTAVGHDGQCVDCHLGKMAAKKHSSTGHYADRPLYLVHFDLIGKMDVESVDGYFYALSGIDEYTGYSIVRFLVRKSEAFQAVCNILQMLERQTPYRVAFVRTDGGKEFARLTSYCEGLGMTHQVTAPHDHQANGKIERLNKVYVERSRCLLSDSQLESEYWAHAMDTVCYTRNFCVASYAIATPHELLFDSKPDVSHLRVFGSVCTAYLPKAVRDGKFSPVSVPGIFLGYSGTAFLVLLESGKISVFSKIECYETKRPKTDWVFKDPFVSVYEDLPDLIPQDHADRVEPDECTGVEADPAHEPSPHKGETSKDTSEDKEGHQVLEQVELTSSSLGGNVSGPHAETLDLSEGDGQHDSVEVIHRYPTRSRVSMANLLSVEFTSGTFSVTANRTVIVEPTTFKEAMNSPDADKWWDSMLKEMQSLTDLGTYTLVELSPSEVKAVKPLPVRWVFRVKYTQDKEVDKFKARLVAKGYKQIYGVDYTEVFAPVSKYTTFRYLLALAVERNLHVHQLDVSTAFLHGDLKEQVYVQQPEGFHVGSPGAVWKLHKALYGLKQAPRAWHEALTSVLLQAGYRVADGDASLYIRTDENGTTYVLIYVDDILVASVQLDNVESGKKLLGSHFSIKDMEEVNYFLGMSVQMERDEHGVLQSVKLTNSKLITDAVADFSLANAKAKATPGDKSWRICDDEGDPLPEGNRYREALGKILYLANTVRPDISFMAGVLSRYAAKPTTHHWHGAMQVLKYLLGTKDLGLVWERSGKSSELVGFVDSDYAGDTSSRKSTSGGVFTCGTAAISWLSKLQRTTALSTVESEFYAMCSGVQEALSLQKLSSDFDHQLGALVLHSDNTGALVNIRGNPSSQRTKHIGVRYMRIRDELRDGSIEVQYVPTEENPADMFTKCLAKGQFLKLRASIGMK